MTIKTAVMNGVQTIEIARPEKKNALTAAMYQSMSDALKAAQADASVRAVLIAGQPGIFTSGNDLEDFMQRPPQRADSPVFQFMQSLVACDKPVVVAVTGAAIGIGTTMLMHCDLVYASDEARFAMPFTSLGLVAEFASSLPRPLRAGMRARDRNLPRGDRMDMLKDKVAIITGADSGIGQATAIEFAREGADVLVVYHTDAEGANATKAEIEALGRRAVVSQGDVGQEADVERFFGEAVEAFGSVDIVMNNAGVDGSGVRVAGTSRAENPFLTAERRGMDAALGAAGTRSDTYDRIMAAVGEPGSDSALSTLATRLETTLMSATASPQSMTKLTDAVNAARELAAAVNRVADETVRLLNTRSTG